MPLKGILRRKLLLPKTSWLSGGCLASTFMIYEPSMLTPAPARPVKDSISAAGLLASIPTPSTDGTEWSRDQLFAFVALVTQQIQHCEAHPHQPREIRGSLINALVIPKILEYLQRTAPAFDWRTQEMTNERRANVGSGFSVGQVPAVDDAGNPLGHSCLGGTYRVHEAKGHFDFSVGYLLSPRVTLLSADVIPEQTYSYAARLARVRDRPADLCAMQAPANSSPGRWLARLHTRDGITPYWLCGGIQSPPSSGGSSLPALNTAPLGVYSEAVHRRLAASGYTHDLLPFSRRDPGEILGQTGRYFTFDPETLALEYEGDVLNGAGQLFRVRLQVHSEISLFTAMAERALRKPLVPAPPSTLVSG